MRGFVNVAVMVVFLYTAAFHAFSQHTEIVFLSGEGSDNPVDWEFYCTEGRNSGKWTTIPVPSNWEQRGFGKYNYGHAKDSSRGKEKGFYRLIFNAPAHWKGKSVNIVFEGSMTDTEVRINGKSAGPVHQGAFYRFIYDISSLLKYGQSNLLEVTVSKHSTNESVNRAERYGDFWIFGGIFRPVYLLIKPVQHINHVALNALADGRFRAEVFLSNIKNADEVTGLITTQEGKVMSHVFSAAVKKAESKAILVTVVDSALPWSSEFPNLYRVQITLLAKGKPVHTVTERFGFRTVELRERDGLYVNGQKIKFKGVNRHSFRPETGRALSRAQCIDDVITIKEMNMNAVRNSHYPPDEYFLDACDSLGLYVMDELAGWHDAYDTKIGKKLVSEMLESNQNHPCIIIWANGNEGGHNQELDNVFDETDLQKRPVCHPWENHRDMDTQHYINYDYGNGVHFHGHDVVFPTEFLHGLYDGGHGAGLYDYWEYMWKHPLSAGGFLWDFADGAVYRTDKSGILDTDGNHAADGILGPYHEREASFYTIKEVWSPIFFEHREITPSFNGRFTIENRYAFTNTRQCAFKYTFVRIPDPGSDENIVYRGGRMRAPDIKPGQKGQVSMYLPDGWKTYDILYVQVEDPHGRVVYTWSWPVKKPSEVAEHLVKTEGDKLQILESADSLVVVQAGKVEYAFSRNTGMLVNVENTEGHISFGNGPVLCDGVFDFRGIETEFVDSNFILKYQLGEKSHYRELRWVIYPSGWLSLQLAYRPSDYDFDMLGVSFSYPEKLVTGVEWMGKGPYRVWKNRMQGVRLGLWEKAYNNTVTGKSDYIYPEFKGYHANLYWAKIKSKEQDFVVIAADEDVFLRLFTPEFPDDPYNTAPVFPSGDISFMHGIPPIGTKSQVAANMGPSGRKNMYFDYWKQRAKTMILYFNFSAK
ncbi:MAG: glycoside hydrolase family 2 [Bacteroidales bacterium]|nr:glycoside hydrolase family 2 [Bacteroidales bacterium]MBN2761979.1 glycoside hydrolase family 2 [Bacteroidales bacterium]